MKKLFFIFVLLCFTFSLGFANNFALDYYNAGKRFQQQEKFTSAIEQYQEALLINPDYADAWIGLAECAYEMDEYSRALTCLETANKYYKYDLKIQRLKGFCYIGLGELEKANVVFEDILKKFPNDVEAIFGLAQLQVFEGRISSAEKYYTQALTREASSKKALLSLALVSLKLGKFEQADNFINQAIYYHHNTPEVYYYASYINVQKGDLSKAEDFIRTAVKLKPSYDEANALLAYILYCKGNYEEAVSVCDYRIAQNRKNSDAWYLKACAVYKLGSVEQSIKSLETVLKINPQDEIARFFLEQLVCQYFEIEDSRRENFALYHVKSAQESVEKYNSNSALFEYIRALQIHPLNIDVRLSYSDWLLNEGYPEASLSELKFIDTQEAVSQKVADRIESYESLLDNTLAKRWDVEPFYLDKTRVSIGFYHKKDNLTMFHAEGAKICSNLIADTFTAFPYFHVESKSNAVTTYSQAFSDARNSDFDYFGIVNFDENDRETTISIDLYVTSTGSLAGKWNVYRSGNKKLSSAAQKIVKDIVSSFAVRGKILERQGSEILIDLGKRDGINLESTFIVAKKDSLQIADSNIGLVLNKENELGSIQLTEIGEDVSQGIFVQKGFYDKMNPNDEILLVEKTELSDENSVVMSDTQLKSPEFLQMLNSIK